MITYLKIIVISLGVLIAAGVAVIGYKLAEGTGELAEAVAENEAADAEAKDEPAAAPAAPPVVPRQVSDLGLPEGARVLSMTTTRDRLVLNVRVPEAGERIIIVDLASGGVIGSIALEAPRVGGP